MQLFDFTEIPAEGERWVRFGQDFFLQLGFGIENPTYRGTENNGDFYAVEEIPGKFNLLPFRWLVSCRHKAATRTAVKESDEPDLLERVLHGKADGFIGLYSTPVSAALDRQLTELKEKGLLKDYRVMDPKVLEPYLLSPGFARIVSRYFPNYANLHRTPHLLNGEYLPIRCDHCGRDLLELLFSEDRKGVVVRLRRRKNAPDEMEFIHDVYVACKGECDERLQEKYCSGAPLSTFGWMSLSDLVMPSNYLERLISLLDQLGRDEVAFSAQALEKEKYLFRALAQRTLREPTDGELKRTKKLAEAK